MAEERYGASPEAWESPAVERWPCQTLSLRSASRARKPRRALRVGTSGHRRRWQRWQRSTCVPSVQRRGSRRERMGQGEEHAPCLVLLASSRSNTGGFVREEKARGSGGKGAPNDTPTPSWRVGWGRGVGVRESRAHQDEDGWRRPLAWEKRATKVPSARVSCPRGGHLGNGRNGNRRFMVCHGDQSQVLRRMP